MPPELITHPEKVFFAERGETKGDLADHFLRVAEQDLRAAYAIYSKQERYKAVDAVKAKVIAHFFPEGSTEPPRYDKLRVTGV